MEGGYVLQNCDRKATSTWENMGWKGRLETEWKRENEPIPFVDDFSSYRLPCQRDFPAMFEDTGGYKYEEVEPY